MSIKRISEPESSQYSKKVNPSHQIMCDFLDYRELRNLNGSDSCADEPKIESLYLSSTLPPVVVGVAISPSEVPLP